VDSTYLSSRLTCYIFKSTLSLHRFFSTDTGTTEIYTLSLHDALPIWQEKNWVRRTVIKPNYYKMKQMRKVFRLMSFWFTHKTIRSEEHTSELQSRFDLVCRLLLEKKKRRFQRMHCHNSSFSNL